MQEVPLIDYKLSDSCLKDVDHYGCVIELTIMSQILDLERIYDAMEYEVRINDLVLSRWHVRSTGNNKFQYKLKFPL